MQSFLILQVSTNISDTILKKGRNINMIRKNAHVISEVKEDVLYASIVGEIDHHSAASLREELDDTILAARPKAIELDLATVDFMDSSGLGVIMGRKSTADRIGAEFRIVNPAARIARIIELAGLGKVVAIVYKNSKE